MATICVIPAAGSSARMAGCPVGDYKPLLPWPGGCVALAAVRAAIDGGCRPLVVTGYRANELEEALASSSAEFVRNQAWASGMLGSIAVGARRAAELDPGGAGFLVSHADMPLVPPQAFALLAVEAERLTMESGGADAPSAVFCSARGRLGHPVWLSYALTEKLAFWDPGASLKAYLHEGRWAACELDEALGAAAAGIFLDLDTPEAYERALASLSR